MTSINAPSGSTPGCIPTGETETITPLAWAWLTCDAVTGRGTLCRRVGQCETPDGRRLCYQHATGGRPIRVMAHPLQHHVAVRWARG